MWRKRRLTEDMKRVDDPADYMENQSRRNNMRVDGVKEKPGETWQETAPRQVVQRELKLPADQVSHIHIERAHRTGAPTTTQRERTIVVKFASFIDRDTINRAERSVKSTKTSHSVLYPNERSCFLTYRKLVSEARLHTCLSTSSTYLRCTSRRVSLNLVHIIS